MIGMMEMIVEKRGDDGRKDVKIMLPLKNLSNF